MRNQLNDGLFEFYLTVVELIFILRYFDLDTLLLLVRRFQLRNQTKAQIFYLGNSKYADFEESIRKKII